MSPSRRDFVKVMSASALGLYSHDLIADLLAQSPPGEARQARFKALADVVLGEARLGGCSYADVRFTMTSALQGGSASYSAAAAGRGGGGGGCRRDPSGT